MVPDWLSLVLTGVVALRVASVMLDVESKGWRWLWAFLVIQAFAHSAVQRGLIT